MKKVLYSTALALFVTAAPVLAAQPVQATTTSPSGAEKGNNIAPRSASSSSRNDKEKKDSEKARKASTEQKDKTTPATTASASPVSNPNTTATSDAPQPKASTVTPPVTSEPAVKTASNASNSSAASSAALMNMYRVGVGDVLDIRLLNSPTRNSTLYTVLPGGTIDYPLAGEPVPVSGLTPEEIASKLSSLIKIYEKPQVSVNVREYQSHSVIVTGLVSDPGLKYLRREAVPLYVVVTEAQPRTEAARAVIMRQGAPNVSVDLSDTNAMSTLVQPGDVIKLTVAPPQFYFVGGAINDPGQKGFHTGLTLTQAILAAGGASRFAGSEVKVSRTGADGKLVTTKYNLKKIEDGKVPDPLLQPGDRIEVSRSGW
ncbi:MAG TPA: polysaccharide biosynthesis/export family protein [Pyrinomonadaceae bacterium]|nr:polysaccharide biosynthesis/export family protein [Pyrinomonadaceae bacterium]